MTTQEELNNLAYMTVNANRFISIEPILESILISARKVHVAIPFADWVIVGAETGNRKGKVVPENWWIHRLHIECIHAGVPVFMKESLRGLMGADFIQEFPWENEGE